MAVFVELVTDSFRDQFATTVAGKRNARKQSSPYGRAGATSVRRPMRGLEIKDDTYAIIRVIQADGTEVPLLDSGGLNGKTTNYANFILQTVQESRMEKHQIVETFGEPFIYFFGESPRFLDVSATLINSNDFNWEAEWWYNYDNYFRGTKSVELGARTYLFYDDNIVEGYVLQAQAVKMSDQPLMLQLSFRMFVTDLQNISFIGDTNFPIRSYVTSSSGSSLQDPPSGSGPFQRSLPLRGAISDNRDEWTGDVNLLGTNPQGDRGYSEVDDLHQTAYGVLVTYGVAEGGPDIMFEIGMGPNFQSGVGIGFNTGASVRASFNARATTSAILSTSSAGASYGGGVGAGAVTVVGGRPSAFAMTSVQGRLNQQGTGQAYPSAAIGISI